MFRVHAHHAYSAKSNPNGRSFWLSLDKPKFLAPGRSSLGLRSLGQLQEEDMLLPIKCDSCEKLVELAELARARTP